MIKKFHLFESLEKIKDAFLQIEDDGKFTLQVRKKNDQSGMPKWSIVNIKPQPKKNRVKKSYNNQIKSAILFCSEVNDMDIFQIRTIVRNYPHPGKDGAKSSEYAPPGTVEYELRSFLKHNKEKSISDYFDLAFNHEIIEVIVIYENVI